MGVIGVGVGKLQMGGEVNRGSLCLYILFLLVVDVCFSFLIEAWVHSFFGV